VNAAAFAQHPEQGALTAEDLRSRMAQDWFNPEDLLLAIDQAGAIVGFHWMKITGSQGEVYVLGVAPEHSHQGIGRALLAAGILHMQRRGVRQAELYVEASQSRVVRMYQKNGFTVRRTDMAYAPQEQR
jgi:mycothiol synthase